MTLAELDSRAWRRARVLHLLAGERPIAKLRRLHRVRRAT